MLHAQTKLLQGMIAGVQVEHGNTLRLFFQDEEIMSRFMKMNLRYKLVLQDSETKVRIKESPYVFFSDCQIDRQGLCLCFPYDLDAVPNLLCLSKPGSEKITTYVPHALSADLSQDDPSAEDQGANLDLDESEETSARILGAFVDLAHPVPKRNHLRLVVNNK